MWWGSAGFVIGTILGSFVKVLADRSLNKRSFWGRSYCPKCKHQLHWYDLLPIVSYITLKGRCRYCNKKIGSEYILVEMVTGVLVGFLFWQSASNFQSILNFQFVFQTAFGSTIFLLELILKTFFVVILLTLFMTDFKKMLIPDRIIIPSIVLGIIANLLLVFLKTGYLYFYLSQNIVGKFLLPPHSDYFRRHALMMAEPFLYSVVLAITVGGFFLSLIIITKGKGMGGGDVKLGVFLGLMLGFPQAVLAMVLAFIIGAVFSIFLILLKKKSWGQIIAFGPFLVLGSFITLFWGSQILEWYLHILLSAT